MLMSNLFIIISAAILVLILLFLFFRRAGTSDEGKLYVGNIPYRARVSDLREIFSVYGQIDNIRIVKDRKTGRAKGFAFVCYRNQKNAKSALKANGKELLGRSLVVRVAINK